MHKLAHTSFGIVGMFVNTCIVAKYVIINWEMFSMKKVNNDTVFGILQLETLLVTLTQFSARLKANTKCLEKKF